MNINNEHWHSDFGFTGPHTTFHHQHFQMVDLIIMNFKRMVHGLNPCAVPYEAVRSDNMTEVKEEREEMKEEGEWITKVHQGGKRRNAEDIVRHDTEFSRNKFHELCEEDEDGEEDEGCHTNFNDNEIEGNDRSKEELTEYEYEIEFSMC